MPKKTQENPEKSKLLAAENLKLRQDRDALLHKLLENKKEISSLSETVNGLKSSKKEVSRLKETINELKSAKKASQSQLSKLNGQNNELANSNKKLRQQLKKTSTILDESKNEISKLSKKFEKLEAENGQLISQLKHKDDMIMMMRDEAERARAEVRAYANATSWKITAPIRAIMNLVKR